MAEASALDILVPTCRRPAALAVTLACLAAQTHRAFRVVVSDQTEPGDACGDPYATGEVKTAVRVLETQGRPVALLRNLPRRGLAQQRQFLLEHSIATSAAPFVLYLDDDLILEPEVVERLVRAVREERCGFAGCGTIGLSYRDDERPHQQAVEFWDGPVRPERVRPGTPEWERHHLHSAANLLHVQRRLALRPGEIRKYRVAWVGACVLYDRAKLVEAGGYGFWRELPRDHCGEDVLAQVRVMARHGGCGVLPSGVYHLELPTTVPHRKVNAPEVLPLDAAEEAVR